MKKIFLIGFMICFLNGCGTFHPVVDARREAGLKEPVGQSRPLAPVVCYGLVGGRDMTDKIAQTECDKVGKKAVFVREDFFTCTLFTPVSARYRCQ